MKRVVKIVFAGYSLLITAIVLNYFSAKVGLLGWYEFLQSDGSVGVGLIDLIWLFFIYPILLGLAIWLSNYLAHRFLNRGGRILVIILTSFILILASLIFVLHSQEKVNVGSINSFEECQDAGYPIAESFPEQCFLPDGRSFTKDDSVVCTMDAKECPDGSFVGRIPPNCEFSPCPGE